MNRSSLCLLIGLILVFSISPVIGQRHNYTLDELLAGLRQNKERIRSIKATYVLAIRMGNAERQQLDSLHKGISPSDHSSEVTRQHVVWIYKDGKYRCTSEINEVDAAGEPIHRSSSAYETTEWNGKTGHSILYEPTKLSKASIRDIVSIHDREDDHLPSPLLFGYRPSMGWVVDVIHDCYFQLKKVTPSPDMGPLYNVEGTNKWNQFTRFIIAPERGFLAVRTERQIDANVFDVDICTKLTMVDGFWFATDGRYESLDANGKPTGRTVNWMENAKIEVNQVDDSVFDIPHPPGSIIVDHDNNTVIKIGAHGESILVDGGLPKPYASTPSVFPLRWLFLLSAISLFLLAAFILIRRRQQRAAA